MKLQREQFLAAAMMLSAAQNLAACRSKPDAGNEGINPEQTENIGQPGPNGALGQDLGAAPNRASLQVGVKVVVPTREAAALAVPTKEGLPIFTSPTREALPSPTREALPSPTREALPSPTREALPPPTNEKIFVPPRIGATAPAKTITPPPPLAPRK